ncbi:uncharacterized protein LOC117100932 [Anneissia japonica]|uniref:uncharacterized protein LOC117100932 n=1 Tax=Anneissia japonica TaxID=1529436 RepID=UPI0014259D62|nr:uncharacterized protein LOC117100932 [Anneissia japonica]
MASLCGNNFMKKMRHGCFAGSAMYSPDVYIMTKKHSRRPKMKKGDNSYGFHQNWAMDNEAMENDSFYVYDGDKKPKKLNLVESVVIEEDCSWFTPKSYQSLAKPTQNDTAKSINKWKTPKSIGTVESKCMTAKQSSSLKKEISGKQSTDTNPFCTPRPPLKDMKNRKQNSGMKSPFNDLEKRKQLPCTSSETKVDQVRVSLTNKNPNAVTSKEVGDNKISTPFRKPQNSNPQHISNNIHKEKKNVQLPVTPDHDDNSRTTKQDQNKFTKGMQDENCDPVEPSFIGIINGPKPHVVLSETVKKNNVKGRRMFCEKLTEKATLFVSETLPDVEDQQMSIDELETTKLMQEHALKEPILPSCDESVAISSHLKLTMSVATDASTMNLSEVEGSKLYNSKDTHQMKSRPNSTDINLDVSSKNETSLGSTSTDFTSTGRTLTDVTTTGVTLTDVTSMGSTLTDVTSMAVSPADASLAGGSLKVTHPSACKRICLPSYVKDDNQSCKTKYQSPTLAQLKMRKQRSVAKLVKAFEDCKMTTTNLFDKVPAMATLASTQKQIEEETIPDDDKLNKDINGIIIHEQSQLLSPILTSQEDLKCESKNICDYSMKPKELEIGIDKNIKKVHCIEKGIYSSEQTAIPAVSKSCLFDYDTISQTKPGVKQGNSESISLFRESVGNKNTKECETGSNNPPEKLSLLWTASMLDDYRSKDFSVGQGTEVIIMNEDDPKRLYVQIATAVNGKVKLKQKTAGYVPRALVLPRFASPATRSTYRSLDSRKKSKNVCGHGVQMLSQKLPFDAIDTLQTPPKIKTSRHLMKQRAHDDYKPIQLSQNLPTVSLLIESYIVLEDHQPIEKDEVEVLAGEVIVVHAGQQRELDWMWVYVPRAEKFGYIPAFCATPMALDSQKSY